MMDAYSSPRHLPFAPEYPDRHNGFSTVSPSARVESAGLRRCGPVVSELHAARAASAVANAVRRVAFENIGISE